MDDLVEYFLRFTLPMYGNYTTITYEALYFIHHCLRQGELKEKLHKYQK